MKSLLLLIDGYNVVAPVAAPSSPRGATDPNWLHRERMLLIQRLTSHLNAETRPRTCVVFDAANPPRDRPPQFDVDGICVRFAVDYPEADDLLEEIIAAHSAPKQLAVVSSDHRIQSAAKRRGAVCFDSDVWLDALLDGTIKLAVMPDRAGQGSGEQNDKPTAELNRDEVNDWLNEFGIE